MAIIDGTSGPDFLVGTAGDDVISGLDGNDQLFGEGGQDTLDGGDGDDALHGGSGADSYEGGAGAFDAVYFSDVFATQGVIADVLTQTIVNDGFGNVEAMTGVEGFGSGTRFSDTFYGDDNINPFVGGTGDYVYAFGGDDFVNIEGAPAVIDGGEGNDAVNGFRQARLVDSNSDGIAEWEFTSNGVHIDLSLGLIVDDGFGGSGVLVGIENIVGSGGADLLIGDDGANLIFGGSDNDDVRGRGGDDVIHGGADHDLINGGTGTNFIDGGDGSDMVSYSDAGSASVDLETGTGTAASRHDTLISIENVHGSSQDDILLGDEGDNIFFGSLGNDHLDGRAGIDTAAYSDATGGVTVDLANGTSSGSEGEDSLVDIENVLGTNFDDRLQGNGGDNVLSSLDGSDELEGRGGNDLLSGGLGNDLLDGGWGNDLLVGGGGDDLLAGGKGEDRFGFGPGSGHDRVQDFDKKEILVIDVAGVDDMSDVAIVQVGKHTLISWDAGTASVTLDNFKAKHLSADNFDFGEDAVALAAQAMPLARGPEPLHGETALV